MGKRIAAVVLIALIMFGVYVAFGTDKPATLMREGISMSIDEDFKIKESIGKVFFADREGDAVSVDGSVEISTLNYPVDGKMKMCESMGEKYIEFSCKRFAGVSAVEAGKIENCENGKVTLRHIDGKISVYSGVGALCKKGQSVEKGEIIGYARENIEYRLYENCIALDPGAYFA